MADGTYNRGTYEIATGTTIWGSSDVRCMLVSTAYTPNRDHNVVDDVVANEISGAARQTLASETVTENDTDDRTDLDCADVTFPAVPGTVAIGYVVFFRHTGSDATAPLLFWKDFTSAGKSTNGGDVGVTMPANRIASIT